MPELHDALLESAGGMISTSIPEHSARTVKAASNNLFTQELLQDLKPDKDNVLVHLVALGDHETYGWNRNNDAYTKQANVERHKTFETHAQVYQEHKNKDKTKFIGKVKKAAYNPDMGRVELAIWLDRQRAPEEFEMAKEGKQLSWSMSCFVASDVCSCCKKASKTPQDYCFPAGTVITKPDGSVVPIEDIKEGDIVLGARGDKVTVVKCFSRHIDEDVYVMPTSLSGVYYDMVCTEEHPILTSAGEFGFLAGLYHPTFRGHSLPDELKYTHRIYTNNIEIPWEFVPARSLRVGDLVKTPNIKKEPEKWDGVTIDADDAWVIGLFLAEGSFSTQSCNGKKSALEFSLHEKETIYINRIKDWAEKKHNKCAKVHRRSGSMCVSVRVNSTELAEKFHSMLGAGSACKNIPEIFLHAPCDIQKSLIDGYLDGDGCYNKKKKTTRVNSINESLLWQVRHILCQLGYTSYISNQANPGGPTNRKKVKNIFYLVTNYPFCGPLSVEKNKSATQEGLIGFVKTPQKTKFCGNVYNFETTDHTYVANGIAVHNCNHMKKSAGQWVPEFEKFAYVYNPDPTFFDISEVKRPADRIAHYLSYHFPDAMTKAASNNLSIGGAELAGLYGMHDGGFSGIAETALLRQLVEFESAKAGPDSELVKLAATSGFDGTPVSEQVMDELRKAYPETLIRKMAKAKVPFSFMEFCRYLSGDSADSIEKSAGYKKACGMMLPSLFSTIGGMEIPRELEQMFEPASNYGASCDPANGDALDKALEVLAGRHGLAEDKIKPRVLNITIIKSASEKEQTFDSIVVPDEDKFRDYAIAYGVYKVAFCKAVKDIHGSEALDPMFLGFVTGQNRI